MLIILWSFFLTSFIAKSSKFMCTHIYQITIKWWKNHQLFQSCIISLLWVSAICKIANEFRIHNYRNYSNLCWIFREIWRLHCCVSYYNYNASFWHKGVTLFLKCKEITIGIYKAIIREKSFKFFGEKSLRFVTISINKITK